MGKGGDSIDSERGSMRTGMLGHRVSQHRQIFLLSLVIMVGSG